MITGSGRAGLLAVLARRDFTLLWTAGLISNLGSWATFVAMPVLVYQQTGSALATTAVFTVSVVPMLLGSAAGILVDRWDRRRILIIANVLLAVITAPLILMPQGHLWVVYASMFGLALIGTLVRPAENALLPTLAGHDQLPYANALNALNDNLGRIAGPALGAALLALGGFPTVIIVDVASFLVAAVLIAVIRIPRPGRPAEPGNPAGALRRAVAEGVAGFRVVRGSSAIAPILAAMGLATVGDAIFSSLLGPYFGGTLAAGGATLGLFLSLRGVGGVLGSLPAGHLSRRVRPDRLIVISLAGCAVLLALLAAVPHPVVACAAAIGLGVFVVGWVSHQQLLIQRNAPDAYLGRVFGIQGTVGAVGMIIGSVTAGLLADVLGVTAMLYLAGSGYLAAAAWLLARYRPPSTPS